MTPSLPTEGNRGRKEGLEVGKEKVYEVGRVGRKG